jgi:hypothetical protein
MKSKGLVLLILLAVSVTLPMAFAVKPNGPSASNGLGKNKREKKVLHLYLYEKNEEDWSAVEDGSWAKITFLTHKNRVIINAHRLEPGYDYSLINYAPDTDWAAVYEKEIPDPWPGVDSHEIASGTVNEEGNLHLKTNLDDYIDGKVWLVLSDDFDVNQMTGWQPSDYLFEYDLVFVPQ